MRPDNTKYRNYILDYNGITVMLLAFFASTAILGLYYAFYFKVFSVDLKHSMLFHLISYLLTFLPSILAFDYFIMRKNGKKLSFNMDTKNVGTYFLIFPMMFGMMLVSEFITNQIPVTGPFFGELYEIFSEQINIISDDVWGLLILTSFFAPILEEIVFRGIIQKGMINKGVKPFSAIAIASLSFGIIHMNPWQFIGGFLLGMVLGLVYFKTKSLLMPILLHFFNNFISSIMMIKYKTESFSDLFNIQEWHILVIGLVMFLIFYYLFMFRFKVHHQENT